MLTILKKKNSFKKRDSDGFKKLSWPDGLARNVYWHLSEGKRGKCKSYYFYTMG